MKYTKRRIWEILDVPSEGDPTSRIFDVGLLAVILLSVTAVILETVDGMPRRFGHAFAVIEAVAVVVFTLEYATRTWACTADRRYRGMVRGRLRFLATPLMVIDLLAILPFYVSLGGDSLLTLRTLRILRIFRMAKIARYYSGFQVMRRVVANKRAELMITGGLMAILTVIAASLMYYCEHEAQPEEFPDIPSAFWWAIVTLTTVGYGDVAPVTALGKAVGGVIAVLGIGMFALPAGVLGAGFVEEIAHRRHPRQRNETCPHCGWSLAASPAAEDDPAATGARG